MADSIREALEMPEEERRQRMRLMRNHLSKHDIHHWADSCLRDVDMEIDQVESVPG
jgi:trehalose-6-phosphate synthase